MKHNTTQIKAAQFLFFTAIPLFRLAAYDQFDFTDVNYRKIIENQSLTATLLVKNALFLVGPMLSAYIAASIYSCAVKHAAKQGAEEITHHHESETKAQEPAAITVNQDIENQQRPETAMTDSDRARFYVQRATIAMAVNYLLAMSPVIAKYAGASEKTVTVMEEITALNPAMILAPLVIPHGLTELINHKKMGIDISAASALFALTLNAKIGPLFLVRMFELFNSQAIKDLANIITPWGMMALGIAAPMLLATVKVTTISKGLNATEIFQQRRVLVTTIAASLYLGDLVAGNLSAILTLAGNLNGANITNEFNTSTTGQVALTAGCAGLAWLGLQITKSLINGCHNMLNSKRIDKGFYERLNQRSQPKNYGATGAGNNGNESDTGCSLPEFGDDTQTQEERLKQLDDMIADEERASPSNLK
ncbi:MAG: hypothetical protein P1U40_07635 [Coxiellaceae bacterium]|nr:hypothetical protein [Coxiellaceae bacterium]